MKTNEEIIASMRRTIDAAVEEGVITVSGVAAVLFHVVRRAARDEPPMIVLQWLRCADKLYEEYRAKIPTAEKTD